MIFLITAVPSFLMLALVDHLDNAPIDLDHRVVPPLHRVMILCVLHCQLP